MASAAEMFQFVAQFGPMLGELAAHVEHLERRVELLEARGVAPAGGAAEADAPEDADEIDFFGQKISIKGMLAEGATKAGGAGGLMERIKNWKPGQPSPAAPAPAAPAATANASQPASPTDKVT